MQSSDKFLDLLWSSTVCCIASVLFLYIKCDFLPLPLLYAVCCELVTVCVCVCSMFIIIVLRHRVHTRHGLLHIHTQTHTHSSKLTAHTLAIWIILYFDFFSLIQSLFRSVRFESICTGALQAHRSAETKCNGMAWVDDFRNAIY